jgi:hypothetical protein
MFHSLGSVVRMNNEHYTEQFKKKVTLSHVYKVTNEPIITWYASIVRKTLKVLICYLTNTQCGNPMSHINPIVRFCSDFLQHVLVYGCHSGDHVLSQFLKIIWQGWYVDSVLDIPPEKDVARCEVWRPGRPSVEGQVNDDSTSNPVVWQIFILVMADFAMKMRQSSNTWMKICHTTGLDMLSSLTCPFTLGLSGRQTSHCATTFSGGMSRTSTYHPCQMIFKNWDSASSPLWQP